MELASSSLQDRFASSIPISQEEIYTIALKLADALEYCHLNDKCHLDIKPANIMDVNGVWKLGDFGIMRNYERQGETILAKGTPPYASLEQMRGEINYQSDLWAYGIVLIEMLIGKNKKRSALWRAIQNNDFNKARRLAKRLPLPYNFIVCRCLLNPEERPAAQQIKIALGRFKKISLQLTNIGIHLALQSGYLFNSEDLLWNKIDVSEFFINNLKQQQKSVIAETSPKQSKPVIKIENNLNNDETYLFKNKYHGFSNVLGIDLGTSNAVVSIIEHGEVTVVTNSEGSRLTPSVVAFTKSGERLIGQPAKQQATINPENTIFSFKRLMGRRYADVTNDYDFMPYKVIAGPKGMANIDIRGVPYSPEEISAMILQKLKTDTEAFLGTKIEKAIITVPAYFNYDQRTATKTAGEIAGLKVLRIINEPTAAALAYGIDFNGIINKKNEKILIWHLGGGSFDISILEIGDGIFEVKSTNGDTHLGGDDWDECIVNWLADEFNKDHNIDLRQDRQALQRLREASEMAKIELSSNMQTTISLAYLATDQNGPKHLEMTLSRKKFENLTQYLMKRMEIPFKNALRDAIGRLVRLDISQQDSIGMSPADLDEVILVGGATRMPMVIELVRKLTGKEPHRGINPDEAVSMGAAILGSVLGGMRADIVLLDVTPLTLGIETAGGVFMRMIERNTTIPTRHLETFTTYSDNQSTVTIKVFQGERDMARNNRYLGQFNLTGIPPAPRGIPKIDVFFDIDENGNIVVCAKDQATGCAQSIVFTDSNTLNKSEVDRMIRNVENAAESSRQHNELAPVRSRGNTLVDKMEKRIKDWGNKISANDKLTLESKINNLRIAISGTDISRIKTTMREITNFEKGLKLLVFPPPPAARR